MTQPAQAITWATSSPKIASWNLEFLTEKEGTGWDFREPADYQAVRRIVGGLDDDFIAFQEVENLAAACPHIRPEALCPHYGASAG